MMLRPEDRQIGIKAYTTKRLTINWGVNGLLPREFAVINGWGNPLFGFKRNFIKKMLASDENFRLALMESGIDVYGPDPVSTNN